MTETQPDISDPFADMYVNDGTSSGNFARLVTYKLGNYTPSGDTGSVPPGEIRCVYGMEEHDGLIDRNLIPITAVPLYIGHMREVVRWPEGKAICKSFNGQVPAVAIEDPLCRQTSPSDVSKALVASGMKDAKVVGELVKKVFATPSGKCESCSITENGRQYRVCRLANPDPIDGQIKCKSADRVIFYDVGRKLMFSIDITGGQMRKSPGRKKLPLPPYARMISSLQRDFIRKGIPSHHVMMTLGSVQEGKYFQYSFEDLIQVTDEELLAEIETAREQAAAAYRAISMYVPKKDGQQDEDIAFGDTGGGQVNDGIDDDIDF